MPNPRYLDGPVREALQRKMVFLGGPRQVGKTTFALGLLGGEADGEHPAYFNWDHGPSAARLRSLELPSREPLLVLDEVHKYARWRGLVKGLFDRERARRRILVTGSARLDHYRKGGDSLAGRYHHFRMHPFSLGEMGKGAGPEEVGALLRFGGFPEPLFGQSETAWRLWQRERITRVVREDLRDLERVREVSLVERLVDLLPARVGSPLSVNGLREDLEVDHKTIEHWLSILESLYLCFRIHAFGVPKLRAMKKARKLYLHDWSMVGAAGPRFENMVACHLLKYCHFVEDTEGYEMELRYLRDSAGREVDFVVLKDGSPQFAVECKAGEKAPGKAAGYYATRTSIPRFYQVHLGERRYESGPCTVLPFHDFAAELGLP